MIAVTSLLDSKHTDLVNTIIQDLELKFGVKQVQTTPYPHITYLTTKAFNLNLLKDYLERFSYSGHVFHVYTTGIGVFPSETPVIHIPVLRTQPLNKFHAQLYKDICKLSIEIGLFSKPKMWLPHISLALGDTNLDLMTPIFKYLAQYTFDWEIKIDNLNILKKDETSGLFVKEVEYQLSNQILG